MELNDFENIFRYYSTNSLWIRFKMFVFGFPKKLGYWGIETSHLALASFGDSIVSLISIKMLFEGHKSAIVRALLCYPRAL